MRWHPDIHQRIGDGTYKTVVAAHKTRSWFRRHRARVIDAPAMTLLYSARSWEEVIFRDELLLAERQQSGLRVFFCITRDVANAPASRVADFTRRIDHLIIRAVMDAMRRELLA